MKRIVVLGSTGSIGTQTLDVVRALPDQFTVVGLAAGFNTELLDEQVAEFKPRMVHNAAGRRPKPRDERKRPQGPQRRAPRAPGV